MALSVNKNGYIEDSVSGKIVGVPRQQAGESTDQYLARGQASFDRALGNYQTGITSGTVQYDPERNTQMVDSYVSRINAANAAAAEAQRIARESALRNAFQSNTQALNSQRSTVGNTYDSAVRQLNATRDAQLPQYQAQKDSAATDAAAQMRRTQALNALSGKFFSGANRDQQFNVLMAQKQAEQGINQAQNQFNTGITNRLSDADAQRVAALNDIAEKLRLTEQQYNQGTLDLTNQIESEKAAGAARALTEGMKWAQDVQDRGVDTSLRREQLDLNRDIFNRGEAWKEKTFGADQESATLNRALEISQALGYSYGLPNIPDGTPLYNTIYKNASLARTSAPKAPTQSQTVATNTADAIQAIRDAAPTMTRAELKAQFNTWKPRFISDMVDLQQLQDELNSVQTKDEIESAQVEQESQAAKKLLDSRPWWQRGIDAIIPGAQYR